MALCPDGHTSAATDYCDVCGLEIASAAPAVAEPTTGVQIAPTAEPTAPGGAGGAQLCPRCGEQREPGARFCEGCSYDFVAAPVVRTPSPDVAAENPTPASTSVTPAPAIATPHASSPVLPAPAEPAVAEPTVAEPGPDGRTCWTATVDADHEYYEMVRAETADDPDTPEVPFPAYCPRRSFVLEGTQLRIGRRSRSQGLTPEIDLAGPPADPGISHLHALLVSQPDQTWAVVDPGSTNGTTINHDPDPIAVDTPIPLHDGDRIHVGAWTTITVTAPPS
jgi:hypothetical protein